MGKILSEFVKENLGKKVLILNFNVEGEIVGYNSELPAIIIRSLDQNFGWGNEGSVYEETNKILVEIDEKDTFKLQEELSPLEEETLILSDFWY